MIDTLQEEHDQPSCQSVRDQVAHDGTASLSKTSRPQARNPASPGIAGLVNDLPRFRPPHSENANTMSSLAQFNAHHPGTRPSLALTDDDTPGHVDSGTEVSTDDDQSSNSEAETLDVGGRLDIIDRIMKSLCASLDSKIAVIRETNAHPTVKDEPKPVLTSPETKANQEKLGPSSLGRPAPRHEIERPTSPVSRTYTRSRGLRRSSLDTLEVQALASAPVPLAFRSPPPPLPLTATVPLRDEERSEGIWPSLITSHSSIPPPPPAPSTWHRRGFGNARPRAKFDHSEDAALADFDPTVRAHGNSTLLFAPSLSTRGRETPRPLWYTPGTADTVATGDGHTPARGPRGSNNLHLASNRHLEDALPEEELEIQRPRRSQRLSDPARNSTTTGMDVPPGTEVTEPADAHVPASSLFSDGPREGQQSRASNRQRSEHHDDAVTWSNVFFDVDEIKDMVDHAPISPANLSSLDTAFIPGRDNANDDHNALVYFSPLTASHFSDQASTWSHAAPSHVSPPEPEQPKLPGRQKIARPLKRFARVAEPDEQPKASLFGNVREEADGDGRRKKTKRVLSDAAGATEGGNRKFACPYFKRNPRKYRKWTSCPGPGWDEVHRVKTHLYRRHPLPVQCPRCWEVFRTDGQLQSHLQRDPPCAISGNRTLQEGFTKDQEKRLRSRKKTHVDMTDEDKWREIYMVLFPDDDQSAIPSPYYSETEDGENRSQGPSGEIEDYATFIRREMPTLVRRELEMLFQREFQDVEERVRPRIAEIVLSLQPKLLDLYKQSQMPLSEYGPKQHEGPASGSELGATPSLSQGGNSGTGTESGTTPNAGLGSESLLLQAQSGVFGNGIDACWAMLSPENQAQTQVPDTDAGVGLNWDFEFDKMLDPLFFMLPPEDEQTMYSGQVPTAQGSQGSG